MRVLRRVDATKNMQRFYAVSVERSLFGDMLLVRRWGRIGTHGRTRSDWFEGTAAAAAALEEVVIAKSKRGYVEVGA